MLSDLKKLSPLLTRREKWKFVILFGLMVVAAVLEAIGVGAIPVFVAFVIKPSSLTVNEFAANLLGELPDEPTVSLVLWASLVLLGFVVFKNLFLTTVYYIQSRIVCRQRARLADRMFRAYQTAPYDWFLQRSTSELQRNILVDTSRILNGVVMPVLDLILALIMSLAIVAVMLVATPGTTLLCLAVVGIGLFGFIKSLKTLMKRVGQIQREEQHGAIKAIQQGFGAFVDARVLGREDHLAKVHQKSVWRFAGAQTWQQTVFRANPMAIETMAVIGLLLILLFLVRSGESLTESLPTLSVVGVALIRLKQIATKIASGVNMINISRPYIPGLVRDLRELEALEAQRREKVAAEPLVKDFDTLELDRVSYTYPTTERPALDGVCLQLRRGESIALVGSTGCGKSTLVSCILGLLEPQSGSIRVNNIDIQKDPEGWRACLGYIPQSVFLIDDTLRANIAFGVPEKEIDPSQLRRALESAALAEFVDSLDQGLDTVIGERGVRLSGGQRQRLGIARALYFNPEVLVMDEATSALDNQTEAEVMRAIQNLKRERTLIMIAHRLSTVKDCDRLYFLEGGKISEEGSYQALLQSSPDFRKMASVVE